MDEDYVYNEGSGMVDPETLKVCSECGADWTKMNAIFIWPYAENGQGAHVNEAQPDTEGLEITADEKDVHIQQVVCGSCRAVFGEGEWGIGVWLLTR